MFGLGKPAGTGLLEEAVGVVPTGSWLRRQRGRSYRIADGRNYALGQGEILANPVQAANLAATYATGLYMPVSLVINDGSERGVWTLPVSNRTWNIVRRGMWRVVNEQGGTASRSVRLTSDAYEICGKSGSAQASCRAVAYEARWVDAKLNEQRRTVPATNAEEAARRVRQDVLDSGAKPDSVQYEVARWWPRRPEPEEGMPSHAWFVGFVQEKSDGHRFTHPRIAFAVMLEYGSSGGRHAGPVAADIVQMIIDEFPQYLGPRT
jgi:cell division protein FtsI/penicillin-binding protein 2